MDVTSVASSLLATGSTQSTPSNGNSVTPVATATTQPNNSQATPVPASPVPQPTAITQNPSAAQIANAVKQMNDSFSQKSQNVYATIGIDKATGVEVVKIVDRDTNQTVVQYPSKAALAVAAAIQHPQGSGGQLINTNA
jgi:uncharacterized FlaG/YvyC family protein